MRTPSLHLHMPHLHMPRLGRRRSSAVAAAPTDEHHQQQHHHHHHPAHQTLRRVEGGIDLFAIALVVLFALAMIYALFTTTGHPAYFDRWPTS